MEKKSNRGVILVISVFLHSLLALLPWQEKSRPLAVSSTPTSPIPITPTSPIPIVDASQLPTLAAVESQPLPVVPPSPLALEVPIPETIDSPIDERASEVALQPAPEVALPPEALIPETSDSPRNILIDEPAPQPSPEADPTPIEPIGEAKIAADWEHLVGHLQDQDEGFGFTLFDIFDLFGETGQANQFFDEDKQPKLDIFSVFHFPNQTPEQVLQTKVMPELTSKTGFDPQSQEDFSVGLAYQLLQGEMLRYLIIVGLRDGEGSVLVLSDSLPGLEP